MQKLILIIVLINTSVKCVKVKTLYAYLGERGKFCGKGWIDGRRRCSKDEYCATGFGGLTAGEFACI